MYGIFQMRTHSSSQNLAFTQIETCVRNLWLVSRNYYLWSVVQINWGAGCTFIQALLLAQRFALDWNADLVNYCACGRTWPTTIDVSNRRRTFDGWDGISQWLNSSKIWMRSSIHTDQGWKDCELWVLTEISRRYWSLHKVMPSFLQNFDIAGNIVTMTASESSNLEASLCIKSSTGSCRGR